MRKPSDNRSSNRQLVYGLKPVWEALRAGRKPHEVLVAEGGRDVRLRELVDTARGQHVAVKYVPRAKLDRAAGDSHHQGVVAYFAAVAYADPDDLVDTLAAKSAADDPPLVLVLDGIEDPRNLGAILRTAECAGVDSVFLPERRAAGVNETVAKASAGAIEHLAIARVTNLSRLIDNLKERNLWVVGTAADATIDYSAWDWTRATAIVLGSEGSGLHRLVREHCDALVRIPVHGKIDSLNVSVAAGVILYEARRQRAALQPDNSRHRRVAKEKQEP